MSDESIGGSSESVARRRVLKSGITGSIALLAGCSGGGNSGDGGDGGSGDGGDGSSGEAATVRWLDHFGSETEQFEQIISMFKEENSNAAVDLTQTSPAEYRQQLSSAIGTPAAPDVFHHWSGPADLGQLAEDDVMLNLDDHLSDFDLDQFAGLAACRYEDRDSLGWRSGSLYALPFNMFGVVYWYNKDVFADAGIDESEYRRRTDVTWDEFRDLCETLSDNGTTPIVMGGSGNAANLGRWIGPALIKAAGADQTLGMAWGQNDGSFTDDAYVEAMSRYQTLFEEGYINDSVNAISRSQSVNLFGTDEGGLYFQGSWMPNQITRMIGEDAPGLGEKYDYFWHPYFPDMYENGQNELNIAVGSTRGINMPKTEERGNREEAVEFLKTFYSQEGQRLLFEEGGVPVARLDAWPDDLNEAQQIQQTLIQAGNEADSTYPFFPTALLPNTNEAFLSGVQELFTGGDPASILETVEQARQEDINN